MTVKRMNRTVSTRKTHLLESSSGLLTGDIYQLRSISDSTDAELSCMCKNCLNSIARKRCGRKSCMSNMTFKSKSQLFYLSSSLNTCSFKDGKQSETVWSDQITNPTNDWHLTTFTFVMIEVKWLEQILYTWRPWQDGVLLELSVKKTIKQNGAQSPT